jgi:hypothetical protein
MAAPHPSEALAPESVHVSAAHEPRSPQARRIRDASVYVPGFGGVPLRSLPPNVFVLGTPGSGKTLLQQAIVASLRGAAQFGGLRHRALVADFKNVWVEHLRAIGISWDQIVVLNPFDSRCSAIDFSRDFKSKADITALVQFFLAGREGVGGDGRFFDDAASDILHALVLGLQKSGESWGLADIVAACASLDELTRSLSSTVAGRNAIAAFLEKSEPKLQKSVFATVKSLAASVEPISSMLLRAKTTISLDRWAEGGGVLVLGSQPRYRELLVRYSNMLVERVSRLLLSRPKKNPLDESWLVIDELRATGKLPSIGDLLSAGREKGVRCFLGTQSIEGLIDVYESESTALEIPALCDGKIILRQGSPKSRDYAASLFGEREELYTQRSYNRGQTPDPTTGEFRESKGWSYAVQFATVPNVTATQLDLPRASPQTGLYGFSILDHHWVPFWLHPDEVRERCFGPFRTDPVRDAGFVAWPDDPVQPAEDAAPNQAEPSKQTRRGIVLS